MGLGLRVWIWISGLGVFRASRCLRLRPVWVCVEGLGFGGLRG